MKNILLTGSNGFIGRYVKEYGVFDNCKVYYGTTSKLDDKSFIKFNDLYSDIEIVLKNLDIDIDIIIHTASLIPLSFESATSELFFKNMNMMVNLSEFAIRKKVSKFIYCSSFGSMVNYHDYDIKDYYTLSKVTGEHLCSLLESNDIETASLRISSPFGEFYNKKNVLAIFIDSALKNEKIKVYGLGEKEQNFIYVGNILEYIQRCLKYKVSGIYDVVSPLNITMKDLAELIVQLTNSKSEIEVGLDDSPLEIVKLPHYSFIKSNELGYKEKFKFEEALKKYISYRKKILQ